MEKERISNIEFMISLISFVLGFLIVLFFLTDWEN